MDLAQKIYDTMLAYEPLKGKIRPTALYLGYEDLRDALARKGQQWSFEPDGSLQFEGIPVFEVTKGRHFHLALGEVQ